MWNISRTVELGEIPPSGLQVFALFSYFQVNAWTDKIFNEIAIVTVARRLFCRIWPFFLFFLPRNAALNIKQNKTPGLHCSGVTKAKHPPVPRPDIFQIPHFSFLSLSVYLSASSPWHPFAGSETTMGAGRVHHAERLPIPPSLASSQSPSITVRRFGRSADSAFLFSTIITYLCPPHFVISTFFQIVLSVTVQLVTRAAWDTCYPALS